MIIKPIEGLCNRLRVIFSYLQTYSELSIYWPVDDKICLTHFLDVFNPIENIRFLENEIKKYDYCGYSPICSLENFKLQYLKLNPKKDILDKIQTILSQLGSDFNACHIRRTDHTRIAINKKLYTTDLEYILFIRNSPNKVFVATDNLLTQFQLKKIFGNKVIINNSLFKGKLRNSSLADAFIDIVICSMAKNFKGSGYSSFTDTINIFKNIKYYDNLLSNDKDK
jgi:hypothetical protein